MPETLRHYFVGLDLGQQQDYSAVVVAERHYQFYTQRDRFHYGGQMPPLPPPTYAVRHVRRWALLSPYPQIVRDTKTLLLRPELLQSARLVIDATGCGLPVLDMFTEARLPCPVTGVLITGGSTVTHDRGISRVPKRDLVATVNLLLQSRRLAISPVLPEADTLAQELTSFKMKINPLGHDSYGEWREGAHDDLVLSLALALWTAEHGPRPPVMVRYKA
jgi:hypothetical protein